MGISFYYAVRILWRECGRELLTNVHKIKIPKSKRISGILRYGRDSSPRYARACSRI